MVLKPGVQAILIRCNQDGSLLGRVRDLGVVLVPANLAAKFSPKLDSRHLGRWLLLDVQGQSGGGATCRWTTVRIVRGLSTCFPNLNLKAPFDPLLINDVPAIVTSINHSVSQNGFLYSEELGRIAMGVQYTGGFTAAKFRPLDVVTVTVRPTFEDSRDFYWSAINIHKPDNPKELSDFPTIRRFQSRKAIKLTNGYGFLDVPELGGGVFFSYNDCTDSLNGTAMIVHLEGADRFYGLAVPTFYGKGTAMYRAVYVKPVMEIAVNESMESWLQSNARPKCDFQEIQTGLESKIATSSTGESFAASLNKQFDYKESRDKNLRESAKPIPVQDEECSGDFGALLEEEIAELFSEESTEPVVPSVGTQPSDTQSEESVPSSNIRSTDDEALSASVPSAGIQGTDEGSQSDNSVPSLGNQRTEDGTLSVPGDPSRAGIELSDKETQSDPPPEMEIIRSLVNDPEIFQMISTTRPDLINQLFRIFRFQGR